MTSNHPATLVQAYVDGQLDLAARLDMEARLPADPALQRAMDDARHLQGLVRGQADYHAAPAALRARMAGLLHTPPLPDTAPPALAARAARTSPTALAAHAAPWRSPPWRRWAVSLAVAACCAVGLQLLWQLLWQRPDAERALADDVVASHVRSTLGAHMVDVASSDRHTVKPFLSLRLGFSPPVQALALPGSSFVGGRVDYLDGRPVAALVYMQGAHVVNAFVWPSSASDLQPRYGSDRGFQTAHWVQRGMTHWVVSDVNPQEFAALVQAVQQAAQ